MDQSHVVACDSDECRPVDRLSISKANRQNLENTREFFTDRVAGVHRVGNGQRAAITDLRPAANARHRGRLQREQAFFGRITSVAMGVTERDRRAAMIEGGMQNAGLSLGIIALQFNADIGMAMIASLWGIWHIISGLSLAIWWRRKDARRAL